MTKRVTMKKSDTRRIAADNLDIVFSSYGKEGSYKLGACVTINHCMIELTDLIFDSFGEVFDYVNKLKKRTVLNPAFERMVVQEANEILKKTIASE